MCTICLGMLLGLSHMEMAGWGCIYSPQHKTTHWKKAAAFCGTPDSLVGSPDSPVLLSGVPSRWICQRRWPLARMIFALDSPYFTPDSSYFTPDSPYFTPDSLVVFPPRCHLELAVRAIVPGAPDSPACGTRQSGAPVRTVRLWQHFFFSWTLLDFHNVFFWGVAFLNVLVQVTSTSCELQTQTLANTLVHWLC
jgi:hypothetical protein